MTSILKIKRGKKIFTFTAISKPINKGEIPISPISRQKLNENLK